MSEEQRYKKVGRRYVPVAWYEATDSWAPGTYLVSIQETKSGRCMNSKTLNALREPITPAFLAIEAAAQRLGNRLTDIVYEATAVKPASSQLTPEQVKAWRALAASGINQLVAQSAAAAAREILTAIAEEAKA